jgi:DNA-binding transcriptional LysR family regulator
LLAGEIDLAFVIGETLDQFEGLEHTLLCTDPFVLISPAAGRPPKHIASAEVADLPLIGEHAGGSCQTTLELNLRNVGVEPSYVFRSNDNSAIQAMVRSGMGHAVMAYLAIEPSDPGIVVRNMHPTLPARHIRIAWRAGRTLLPAAQRFVDIATEVCALLSPAITAA